MRSQKSLKMNMVLNAVKGMMGIIFPLITFPYISKVLGVDKIGYFNFANSIICYMVLVAGLGINTYAIREGARLRDNSDEFKKFADEVFTINILSTFVAYILFGTLFWSVDTFVNYRFLLLLLSVQVIFKTIGVEWLYSVYEDYAYITIRSVVFQIISVILMFCFVKTENDIYIYAFISVFSIIGSNVLNFIHAKKYCNISVCMELNLKKHIRPILVLFAMSATVTIYVSSDVTFLGIFCGDYNVGIYSVSAKVYSIVKTLLSAILVVSIPRLSAILGEENQTRFSEVAIDIYNTLLTFLFPSIVGIIILRKQIIMFLADDTYLEASTSLSMLSIALLFCLGAWFWGQCILIPNKQDNAVFMITIISAMVNVVLNYYLIPIWKENAAAFSTIIAEGISFIWCRYRGGTYVGHMYNGFLFMKIGAGCFVVSIFLVIFNLYFSNSTLSLFISIIIAVFLYVLLEIILKNDVVIGLFYKYKKNR